MEVKDLLNLFHGGRKPAQAALFGAGAPGTVPLRGYDNISVNEETEPMSPEAFKSLIGMGESVPGVNEQAISSDKLRDLISTTRAQGVQTDLSPLAGFTKGVLGRDIGYQAPESADSVFGRLGAMQDMVGNSEATRANTIINAMKMGMNQTKTTIGQTVQEAQKQLPREGREKKKLDMKGYGDRIEKDKVQNSIDNLEAIRKAIPTIFDSNNKTPIPGFDQSFQLNPFKDKFNLPDTWQHPLMHSLSEDGGEANRNKQAVEGLAGALRQNQFGATLTPNEQLAWAEQMGTAAGQGPNAIRLVMSRFRATVQGRLRNRETSQREEAAEYERTFGPGAPTSNHPVFSVEGGVPSTQPGGINVDAVRAEKARRQGRTPQSVGEPPDEMPLGVMLQNGYRAEPSPGGFSRAEEGYMTYPTGWRQEPEPEMFVPRRESVDEFVVPPMDQSFDIDKETQTLDEPSRGPATILKETQTLNGPSRGPATVLDEIFTWPLDLVSQFDQSSKPGVKAYKEAIISHSLANADRILGPTWRQDRELVQIIREQGNIRINNPESRLLGPKDRRAQETQGTPYERLKPGLTKLLLELG